MLSIPEPMRARAKLHRHRLARTKETGEVGADEDAEDEVQAKEVQAKGSRHQEVVVQDRGRCRINHKVKGNKQVIFHLPVITVVDTDIGPKTVQARGE